jgi:hypothetical protein
MTRLIDAFKKLLLPPWLRRRRAVCGGISVIGTADFIQCTEEALQLLRATTHYPDIQRYVSVIKQGRRSGMWAQAKRPTFAVGRRTWSHSALWYAGAIAHDAHHSKLYHDAKRGTANPPADCWTGPEAERKCLASQIETLKTLGADDATVAYLEKLRKNPTYQGHHKGWRSWRDYLRRRW